MSLSSVCLLGMTIGILKFTGVIVLYFLGIALHSRRRPIDEEKKVPESKYNNKTGKFHAISYPVNNF